MSEKKEKVEKPRVRSLSPRYMAARVLLDLLKLPSAKTVEDLSDMFGRKVTTKMRTRMLDHFARMVKTVENRARKHKDTWENPPATPRGKPFPKRGQEENSGS